MIRRMGPAGRVIASSKFLAPLLVLLVLWPVLIRIFDVNPQVFPDIMAVASAGLETVRDGSLFAHVGASLARVAVGTVLAILTAVPLGIAMGVSPAVSDFLTPLLRFFSVLFVIFNAVFFIVAYNTLLGVSTIPMPIRHAAASLGAGRRAMLTDVLLPGALPNTVTGIRTGLGFAWRGLIAAEIIATNIGLGYMIFVARDFYRTEVIVFGMIVIGGLWLLIDRLLLAPLERATIERWGMVRSA